MRPQVVLSGRVGVMDVHSMAVVGSVGVMRRQGSWQRCVGKGGVKGGRQVLMGSRFGNRFAAMSRSEEAVEVALSGNSREGGRVEEGLVSSVGMPAPAPVSFRDWFLAEKQLVAISFTAFVTAGSMSILVAAAIPSLLAIKKAAKALEKLADTAREELPGTMAAIRLSGMEISDLTMELNDLGQEISKGVRSSARVLSSAETGMRQVGGIASNGAGSRPSSSNAAPGGPHRKAST